MKVEYLIINKDDCVAVVYKHESLGRIVMIRGNIDLEYKLIFQPLVGDKVVEKDMMEFLLKTLPREDEPKTKDQQ